ncbi:hypothetical protein GOBAR_AA02572 [Gossypium barbadense]|uniref:Uncharacterized protein n=1 Tax=Gossypium barbadense TaxID=3634 RepID=A0A2P5YQW5_GOSBA|nr:hypothetical protein GOBAR_AA02572 [Gossypium barbadense]
MARSKRTEMSLARKPDGPFLVNKTKAKEKKHGKKKREEGREKVKVRQKRSTVDPKTAAWHRRHKASFRNVKRERKV